MKVERLVHTSLLFDLYGSMLNDNQREVLHLYLDNNVSLLEIAEKAGITKQAVSDVLVRAIKRLEYIDNRLHLLDKYQTILDRVPKLAHELTKDVKLQQRIQDVFVELIRTLEA